MIDDSNKITQTAVGGVYVFIDAANLWQAIKAKGRFVDFEKTVKYLKKKYCAKIIKCFYYTAYPAEGTRNYSTDGKHKFFTYLKKALGFVVVKKELKRIDISTQDVTGIVEKGNMDVEFTIDVIHNIEKYDTALFFTGDSDFLALVTYLKSHNKKVYIYSSRNNVSQELRTGADGYVDVLAVEEVWGKELRRRTELTI